MPPLPDGQSELVLRPSKGKMVLLLLVSLAFVAIGIAALGRSDWGVGLSCTIFFGFGVVVFAYQLSPGASYLKLTTTGFVVRSLFRPSPLILWNEVSNFRVASLPPLGKRMVVYDSINPARPGLAQLNRDLIGASNGLPDNYGLKYQELADLMNAWQSGTRRS
jgi:hypothetical protein